MYAHLTDEMVGYRAWETLAYQDPNMVEALGDWELLKHVNRPLATEWFMRLKRALGLDISEYWIDQFMADIAINWREYSFNWTKYPAVTEVLKGVYQEKLNEWILSEEVRRVC